MHTTDPDIRTSILPNGLRVATAAMPGFRTVAIGAWLRVGSRDEPAMLNGLSHFYEHMAFKGTALRDAHAITLEIERVGGSINAYTAKDHTACEALMLADHADTALAVMADVLGRSVFPPDEIARERDVILQELGDAADDPESVAQDAFDALAFPRQALGRPILGRPRNIRRIARDDLLAHQARCCTGANLVVTAAGGVDHDAFVAQVERHFGALPVGERLARDPARWGGGYRHLDDDTEQTSVVLGWPVPGRDDPAHAVHEMLAELLGGGMSSPLFQAVREQRGLAYQIDAWTDSLDDAGVLQVTAGVSPRNLGELLQVALDTVARATVRLDADDVERSRNQQAMRLARSLERPASLAEWLGRDLLAHGRVVPPAERLAQLQAIDESALRRALAAMLEARPTLALAGRLGRTDPQALLRAALGNAAAGAAAAGRAAAVACGSRRASRAG
jgi:predicted Zn-dependent peptidase